jgi:hypothetical protein
MLRRSARPMCNLMMAKNDWLAHQLASSQCCFKYSPIPASSFKHSEAYCSRVFARSMPCGQTRKGMCQHR